jgi:hydroxypyruvate isomerase
MPRFAANLTMLFNEVDLLDRFEAAANAGFRGVEFLFPYAWPKEVLAERLSRHGLTQALHNMPPGDWAKGERGIASLPGREGEFRDGVGEALTYAKALGCTRLNCLAGIPPKEADPETVRRTLVENLRFAARETERAGIRLLVEPINSFDMPGFYLNRSGEALSLFDEVGERNLWLQYDVYHMQRMEGELAGTLARHLSRIAHIQIADNPGRNEPGSGEIAYDFLFRRIDELGYDGWIGCEYKPRTTTLEGLGWLRRAAAQDEKGGRQ